MHLGGIRGSRRFASGGNRVVAAAAGAECLRAFSAGSSEATSALRFCKCAFALASPMVSRRARQFSCTLPLAA